MGRVPPGGKWSAWDCSLVKKKVVSFVKRDVRQEFSTLKRNIYMLQAMKCIFASVNLVES